MPGGSAGEWKKYAEREVPMEIVFLLYEGMTALDLIAPHEILCRLPDAIVRRVANSAGAKAQVEAPYPGAYNITMNQLPSSAKKK